MRGTRLIVVLNVLAAQLCAPMNVRGASPEIVPAEIVVSPGGNDQGSGDASAPFATLHRAQAAVRVLKQREPERRRPITIVLRGGVYVLPAPLIFTSADSGTAEAPIIYQAAPGEHPIISGGTRIKGWQADAGGRWLVVLPEVKAQRWFFTQLFVDNQRRFRPRLPRGGYHQIAAEVPPSKLAAAKGFDGFLFEGQDISAGWSNLADVEVLAFHKWSMSRLRIRNADPASREVRLTGHTEGMNEWTRFAPGNRYLVENVKEALAEPGQWYLERTSGTLTYIPKPGEQIRDTIVIAPRVEQLVQLVGGGQHDKWVEHLEFRGLDFAHANWVTPPTGQSVAQAEVNLGGAISARWARDVRLTNCRVRHVGAYGISLGDGCRNCRIDNCELVDLGAGGIKIGPSDDQNTFSENSPTLNGRVATGNVVSHCKIAHAGRVHPAGIGVWIGHAADTTIEHNDIYDLYYTGVSVGWVWGYNFSPAHRNRISFNHIHTLGQGVLSDMAGVYAPGPSPGTVVDHNVIHDVQSSNYGGWGLYCDEGSSDIHMHDNLVYRTTDGSFHQHYGRNNVIENNILALARQRQLSREKGETHHSFTFRGNIVYWSGPPEALYGDWQRGVTSERNLYWNASGQVRLGSKTLAERQQRDEQDRGSVVADPLFEAAEKGNFRLRAGSPARSLGFRPFDVSKAGRTSPGRMTSGLPQVPRAFP